MTIPLSRPSPLVGLLSKLAPWLSPLSNLLRSATKILIKFYNILEQGKKLQSIGWRYCPKNGSRKDDFVLMTTPPREKGTVDGWMNKVFGSVDVSMFGG